MVDRTKDKDEQVIIIPNKLDDPPHNSSHFGKLEYWEKHYYINPKPFEWYQDYSGIKDIVTQFLRKTDKILNIGCGTSLASEEMYLDGYKNIMNIDYSQICVEEMNRRYANDSRFDSNTFAFISMDARNMQGQIKDKSFDCVIDKGTLDCILCGEYSQQNARKYLSEISRVLNDQGVYILITYGHNGDDSKGIPGPRRPVLNKPEYEWKEKQSYRIFKPNVNDQEKFDPVDTESYHYIYSYKKGEQTYTPKAMMGAVGGGQGGRK